MGSKFFVKYLVLLVLKGIIGSFVTLVGLTVGGMAATAFGLTAPAIPVNADQGMILIMYALVWFFSTIIIGEIFKRLNQRYFERFICIFLFGYIVQGFLQVLEQIIFTSMMSIKFGLVFNIFPSLFLSLIVALLWKPENNDSSLIKQLKTFFSGREAKEWIWRIVAAWLVYTPIYYIVGSAISPVVKPYYTDASLNLGLVLPDWKVIVGMQVIRGAFYLFASLPIIIMWRRSGVSLWLMLGAAIFINVASLMLLSYWLPSILRITHGIELTIDSFLQAFIYVKLLYRENGTNLAVDKDVAI